MPGAGINAGNIRRIAYETGPAEFHFSARETVDGPMRYRSRRLPMGDADEEYLRRHASAERTRKNLSALI